MIESCINAESRILDPYLHVWMPKSEVIRVIPHLLCPVVVLSLQMTYLGCLWLMPTPRSKSAFYGALLSAGTGKRDAREWDPML